MAHSLLDCRADPDAMDAQKRRALQISVEHNRTDFVKLLLIWRADLGTADTRTGSALHVAALRGHTAAARLLLEYRAPAQARNSKGETPLHLVRSAAGAKLLLDHGAELGASD